MNPSEDEWICDGIGFYAFETEHDGTVPVYQYSCKQKDGYRFHFSTGNKPQK